MPIYEYQCQACRHEFETIQKFSDPPLTRCPECGKNKLKKKISAVAFRLKGGGWYETDFKSGDKKNVAGSADSGDASDASTKSESASSENKSSEAKSTSGSPPDGAGKSGDGSTDGSKKGAKPSKTTKRGTKDGAKKR
jgi:putative FmdB family regulatory protein